MFSTDAQIAALKFLRRDKENGKIKGERCEKGKKEAADIPRL